MSAMSEQNGPAQHAAEKVTFVEKRRDARPRRDRVNDQGHREERHPDGDEGALAITEAFPASANAKPACHEERNRERSDQDESERPKLYRSITLEVGAKDFRCRNRNPTGLVHFDMAKHDRNPWHQNNS